MDVEIKSLFDEQMKTFEAFKAANDALADQVKKLGAADALTAEQVKRLNDGLDTIGQKLADAQKRADDMEKRMNRPGAGAHGDAERKEAEWLSAFNLSNRLNAQLKGLGTPSELSLEDYRSYKQGLVEYFRRGDASPYMTDVQAKAMRVGVDTDGGYLVTPDMTGRIVTRIFDRSPIRQIAATIAISTGALEGVNDTDEADSGWVGEEAPRSDTDAPTVGKWRIPVFELYAQPKVTQTLLDDAGVDVESWLAMKIADRFARQEGEKFVSGAGTSSPRGFMSYASASVTTADGTRSWGVLQHVISGAAAGFPTDTSGYDNADALINLMYELKPEFRANARWVMARRSVAVLRKLKDANGNYLWRPGAGAAPSSFNEFPITEAEDMPAFGAGLFPIAFGDFREGYQIVDRIGIRTLRDPYTSKPYVRFYTTRRVGGDVINFEAIKLLKCSA